MLILVLNQKKVRTCFHPIFVPKILRHKHALFIHKTVLRNLTKPTMTNIPISKSDPFTKKFNLEWESLGGNEFYEKVLNGTINMVSTKPDINRLFLTANHLE